MKIFRKLKSELISIKEAAQIAETTPQNIHNLISRGRIRKESGKRYRKATLVYKDDIEEWIFEKRQQEACL